MNDCQIVLPSNFFEPFCVGVLISPLQLNGGLPIIKLYFLFIFKKFLLEILDFSPNKFLRSGINSGLISLIKNDHKKILESISNEKVLSEKTEAELKTVIQDFIKTFN